MSGVLTATSSRNSGQSLEFPAITSTIVGSLVSSAKIPAAGLDSWGSSAVTIILNLSGSGSVRVAPGRLLELVKSALRISYRDDDISSLNASGARITRDVRGNLVIEIARPDHVSSRVSIDSVAREESKKSPALSGRNGASAHSRLARELRDLTGLPAASLASAFGVSREQYQRWISGRPISDIRHGQLVYAHTIAVDSVRKLGVDGARVWWRTPAFGGETPEDFMRRRNLAAVYRLVVELPDPRPLVGSVEPGLRSRDDDWDEEAPEGIEDQEDWSPYSRFGDGA